MAGQRSTLLSAVTDAAFNAAYGEGAAVQLLRISTNGFTGTLDLQGVFRGTEADGSGGAESIWENEPYLLRVASTPTFAAESVAQLSYVADTGSYIVALLEPRPMHRVLGTRTAGDVTVHQLGLDEMPLVLYRVASPPVNTEATLLASAVRSTTANSPDQTNNNGRGVTLYVNVTAYTLGSLTPRIQFKDPVSGTYGDVWIADTAISTADLYIYEIYPGVGGDVEARMREFNSMVLPRTWRVQVVPSSGDNITYSVAAAVHV